MQHQRAAHARSPGRPPPWRRRRPSRPASAPWRSSPPSSRTRNACSSAVARASRSCTAARRAATEPGPLERADRGERGLDVGDGQRARAAAAAPRRRGVAQQRPADADLALGQLAREPADDRRDLVRAGAPQQLGERGDLRVAGRRRRDRGGGVDQLGEMHALDHAVEAPAEVAPSGRARPGCRSRRRSRRGARTRRSRAPRRSRARSPGAGLEPVDRPRPRRCASAARSRPATSRSSAIGKRASWAIANAAPWWRVVDRRQALRRRARGCASSSAGRTPRSGAARP